jgi:hypothetical protein
VVTSSSPSLGLIPASWCFGLSNYLQPLFQETASFES